MMQSLIVAASLLALGAVFGAPLPTRAVAETRDPQLPVMSASGKVRYVVQNANDCAPSQPIAVWGPGPPTAMPLGYRCVDFSNGG
jgi:hypothetical protein